MTDLAAYRQYLPRNTEIYPVNINVRKDPDTLGKCSHYLCKVTCDRESNRDFPPHWPDEKPYIRMNHPRKKCADNPCRCRRREGRPNIFEERTSYDFNARRSADAAWGVNITAIPVDKCRMCVEQLVISTARRDRENESRRKRRAEKKDGDRTGSAPKRRRDDDDDNENDNDAHAHQPRTASDSRIASNAAKRR